MEILGDIRRTTSTIVEYSSEAEKGGAKLVCFPECYLQGYLLEARLSRDLAISLDSEEFASILRRFEKLDLTIVFGMIEEHDDKLFNTAVVVKDGVLQGAYRKTNLLPEESKIFAPGEDSPLFDLGSIKFGINICYDLNFPNYANLIAEQGAQLLVSPCNNMLKIRAALEWKEKHNAIRARRCKESKMWLLSSDVTGERDGRISYGPTAIINPDGRVVAQALLNKPGSIAYEIAA